MQNGNRRVLHMDSKHFTAPTTRQADNALTALAMLNATPAGRRLIAAGIKRGNERLIIQAVKA